MRGKGLTLLDPFDFDLNLAEKQSMMQCSTEEPKEGVLDSIPFHEVERFFEIRFYHGHIVGEVTDAGSHSQLHRL